MIPGGESITTSADHLIVAIQAWLEIILGTGLMSRKSLNIVVPTLRLITVVYNTQVILSIPIQALVMG